METVLDKVTYLIEEYYRTNCSNVEIYNEIQNYVRNAPIGPLFEHLLNPENDISLSARYYGVIILNEYPNLDNKDRCLMLLITLQKYCNLYIQGNHNIISLVTKLIESVMKMYISIGDYNNFLGYIIKFITTDVDVMITMTYDTTIGNVEVVQFLDTSIVHRRLVLLMVKILLEEMRDLDNEKKATFINENNINAIMDYNINLLIETFKEDHTILEDLLFDTASLLLRYDSNIIIPLLKLMTIDNINYKYTDFIINTFYNIMEDNSKLDYNVRYMIELYFNPGTVLANHNNLDLSLIDPNFGSVYLAYLIKNHFLDELSNLSLFYMTLLDYSNKILLSKLTLGEDVSQNFGSIMALMKIPLVPIEEEQFSSNLLPFWSDVVDNLVMSNNTNYNYILNQLLLSLIEKMSLANYHDNVEFLSFRSDAVELIKNTWNLLGNSIVYEMLEELIGLTVTVNFLAFENYINILSELINYDSKVTELLKMNDYDIIKKLIQCLLMTRYDGHNISIMISKTLTTFLKAIDDFLDANSSILENIVVVLLDNVFNHKLDVQIERASLQLLNHLVTKSSDKLLSFSSSIETTLASIMKSNSQYSHNAIVTLNELYGCMVSTIDPNDVIKNNDDCIEIGNGILAKANNYLTKMSTIADNKNSSLRLKCIKSFLKGLGHNSLDCTSIQTEDEPAHILVIKQYLNQSSVTTNQLLKIMNESFDIGKDTHTSVVQSWIDIFVFLLSNKNFNVNLEALLQILANKLYLNNLIENTKIYGNVLSIIQLLVDNGNLTTLLDFKVIYNTLIVNADYSKNNLVNIISKDMDLLEVYYNILHNMLSDHSKVIIPNSSDYNSDDDISTVLIFGMIKDYQKRQEKFILVAISKCLVKLFANKKFNSYQNQLINNIFINDGNFLSYSYIFKLTFMKILNVNGDFDYLVEMLRNIINKHKMRSKKWLELVINDEAFINQCLLLNGDKDFVNRANFMLIKKIQVCNGSRKVISVVNDWYKELLRS